MCKLIEKLSNMAEYYQTVLDNNRNQVNALCLVSMEDVSALESAIRIIKISQANHGTLTGSLDNLALKICAACESELEKGNFCDVDNMLHGLTTLCSLLLK